MSTQVRDKGSRFCSNGKAMGKLSHQSKTSMTLTWDCFDFGIGPDPNADETGGRNLCHLLPEAGAQPKAQGLSRVTGPHTPEVPAPTEL